jgi:transposase
VIRVPSEEEERARHWGRQREQLVHHRQKLEAQGRSLLIDHDLPAPALVEAAELEPFGKPSYRDFW